MVRLPLVARVPFVPSARFSALGLALLFHALGAQAQPAPREAVGSPAGGGPAVAATAHQPSVQPGTSYTVRSGDTLDRIIAQSQPSSPLSLAFLRDAFARLNPAALPRGPQGPLMAGAVLRIPDAVDLRRLAFPDLDASSRHLTDGSSAAPSGVAVPLTAAQREEIERRSWVRYP